MNGYKNYETWNVCLWMQNDEQIDRVKNLPPVPRSAMRLLNIPIAELRKTVVGSAEEAILKSYLLEISNESGKLSSGAQNSVRELSPYQAEKWNLVHDEKLPAKELFKVLDETKKLGHVRLNAFEKTRDNALKRMERLSEGDISGRGTKELEVSPTVEKGTTKESTPKSNWVDSLPMPKDNPNVHKGSKAKDERGNTWIFDGTKWEKQ